MFITLRGQVAPVPAALPMVGSEPDEEDSRRNALVRKDGCPLLNVGDNCGAGVSIFLAFSAGEDTELTGCWVFPDCG